MQVCILCRQQQFFTCTCRHLLGCWSVQCGVEFGLLSTLSAISPRGLITSPMQTALQGLFILPEHSVVARRRQQRGWAPRAAARSAGSNAAPLYVGIDFGTSGARAVAIDDAGNVAVEVSQSYARSDGDWGAIWERC